MAAARPYAAASGQPDGCGSIPSAMSVASGMTRAGILLGADYDAPAQMPADAAHYFAKRQTVQTAIERLKPAGESSDLDLVWWEMALLRFSPIPPESGTQYEGVAYEQFAANFGLTPATADYAVERAAETDDIVLRLHYLAFALDRMPQTGALWIERQRAIMQAWRQYVDECRAVAQGDSEGNVGLFIERALTALGAMTARAGVLRGNEASELAAWLLQLATDVRAFPGSRPELSDFWRQRWVAPYLRFLPRLPPAAADNAVRTQAFTLLDEAASYYAREPLNDHFSQLVSEVRYELRTHWGDQNAHRAKIREQFDTVHRRALFHKGTGNGMLTQHFFRDARRMAETHRQYFTAEEVDLLMSEERTAIQHAVDAGEFKKVSVPVEIPREMMVRLRDTPEETINSLVAEVAIPIAAWEDLESAVRGVAVDAPLHMMFSTSVFGEGKVVGESISEEKNVELEIERYALLHATITGQAMSATIAAAAQQLGLTVDHVMVPLAGLAVDTDTHVLVRHACERLIAEDFISACHVLVPRVEDALRQQLRARGLHATEFRRDVGDGTSRTDDEPLGSMLARTLPDGMTVRDYLGADFAAHIEWTMTSQTGFNLRNTFAHGQARPRHCTPENAGIVLAILFKLAAVARSEGPSVEVKGIDSKESQ